MANNQSSTPSSQTKKYRIKVDRNLCIGAASCVALAMKTFALDSENKAIVLDMDGDEREPQSQHLPILDSRARNQFFEEIGFIQKEDQESSEQPKIDSLAA